MNVIIQKSKFSIPISITWETSLLSSISASGRDYLFLMFNSDETVIMDWFILDCNDVSLLYLRIKFWRSKNQSKITFWFYGTHIGFSAACQATKMKSKSINASIFSLAAEAGKVCSPLIKNQSIFYLSMIKSNSWYLGEKISKDSKAVFMVDNWKLYKEYKITLPSLET